MLAGLQPGAALPSPVSTAWTGLRDQTQDRCAPHWVMPQLACPLLEGVPVLTWTMSPFHSLFTPRS